SFTLTGTNNTATLAAGPSGVAGTVNGQAYALTLTANDTTVGTSSPAAPLDVVVGTGGSDTISVATLLGASAAATPTFVYGMGGADTIDGSGMTGTLLLAGGGGADTMTGGSGTNHYLYGANSDSTATAMDVITNFHAAVDVIDLTGLGTTLKYAGDLRKGQIGAHAVGWQTSGSETYVYVNTSSGTESVSAANMKIDLHGSMKLNSANFLHL
ncbi:MAG: M10 family metallopeptidase C-terminal domain-containing protein, partial [Rhodospirillales bacterium]|nr:M10 family metallopeptidase C-terminal domain-containing protein [Rhodospirillales bacterium]